MAALYGARPDVSGLSLQAAIAFTGVSQTHQAPSGDGGASNKSTRRSAALDTDE